MYPSLAAGFFEGNGCKITKLDKKIGVPRAGLVTTLVWPLYGCLYTVCISAVKSDKLKKNKKKQS